METYIVSIISAFLGYVSSCFANRKSKGILPTIGILSLLAFTAAGLTFVGHWIIKPPQPPPNRLEGQWIEQYVEGEKTYYAIAKFRYDSGANYLEFSGNAYDLNQNLVGHWLTTQARLDSDRNQYDYIFEGDSMNLDDKSKQGHRQGVGRILFDSPTHGKGTFLSVRNDPGPRDFELYKILNDDSARESINNPKGFIQKAYDNPCMVIQCTSR